MAVKREHTDMRYASKMHYTCPYCGKTGGCNCRKTVTIIKGIVFLLFGYLLWAGSITLTATIALLLLLMGLKFLIVGLNKSSN